MSISLRIIMPSYQQGCKYSKLPKSTYFALATMILKAVEHKNHDFGENFIRGEYNHGHRCTRTENNYMIPYINHVFECLCRKKKLLGYGLVQGNSLMIKDVLDSIQNISVVEYSECGQMVNRDFYDGCLRNIIMQTNSDVLSDKEWQNCRQLAISGE